MPLPSTLNWHAMAEKIKSHGKPIVPVDIDGWITEFQDTENRDKKKRRVKQKDMLYRLCDNIPENKAKFLAIIGSPDVVKFLNTSKSTKALLHMARQDLLKSRVSEVHEASKRAYLQLDIDKPDSVSTYASFTNDLSKLVTREILSLQAPIARVEALTHWIDVANDLYEKGDINATFAILDGIKSTETYIPLSHNAISKIYQEKLAKLLLEKSNYSKRNLNDRGQNYIPYTAQINSLLIRRDDAIASGNQDAATTLTNTIKTLINNSKGHYKASPEMDLHYFQEVLTAPRNHIDNYIEQNQEAINWQSFNENIIRYELKLKVELANSTEFNKLLETQITPSKIKQYLSNVENSDTINNILVSKFEKSAEEMFKDDKTNIDNAFNVLLNDKDFQEKLSRGDVIIGQAISHDSITDAQKNTLLGIKKWEIDQNLKISWEDHKKSQEYNNAKQQYIDHHRPQEAIIAIKKSVLDKYVIDYRNNNNVDNQALYSKYKAHSWEKLQLESMDSLLASAEANAVESRKLELGESIGNRLRASLSLADASKADKTAKSIQKSLAQCPKHFKVPNPAEMRRATLMQNARALAKAIEEQEEPSNRKILDKHERKHHHRPRKSRHHRIPSTLESNATVHYAPYVAPLPPDQSGRGVAAMRRLLDRRQAPAQNIAESKAKNHASTSPSRKPIASGVRAYRRYIESNRQPQAADESKEVDHQQTSHSKRHRDALQSAKKGVESEHIPTRNPTKPDTR